MRIDPAVERVLDGATVTYELVRKHDHVFAVFPNGERVLVGAKRSKLKNCTLHNCIANVKRVIRHNTHASNNPA